MNTKPDPVVLVAVSLEQGAIVLRTGDGREWAAETPGDLWSDLMAIVDAKGARALPGREDPRVHRVRAEVIDAPNPSDHQRQEDTIREALTQAADVAEEAAAQEWGAFGRLCARAVRSNAPTVASQLQSTLGRRKRRS